MHNRIKKEYEKVAIYGCGEYGELFFNMLGKCDEVKVEGYEANVIFGAEKVLRQAGAYLVKEFNPSFYICNNQVDRYLKIMNKIYDNFAELGSNDNNWDYYI